MDQNIKNKIKKYPIFYQKVWAVTATIPIGETRSYFWVAEQIGNLRAERDCRAEFTLSKANVSAMTCELVEKEIIN